MGNIYKTIDDITRTKTAIVGDERVPGRDSLGDFKITITNLISSLQSVFLGEEMKIFYSYKPISASFPWLCMSLPDQTLSTTHFSQAFIDVLRARKVIYDEFNTAVSAFTGTWSGSNFTLDNNAANVAMIAELYEDWLFAGSPASGWRILVSNDAEYNITGFTVASRIITVSGSPAGTAIEIYLNRILGSTTSAKHFSWSGLGLYMTGQNKITGLRRRDKMQQITGTVNRISGVTADGTGVFSGSTIGTANLSGTGSINAAAPLRFNSANSPNAHTGPKTEMESGTAMLYLYVGSYTA